MQRFTLSGWKVKDNIIENRLRFFTVYICQSDNKTLLRVVDNYGQENILGFKTLEEAITFTEKIILRSRALEGIRKSYQEMYDIEDEDCEVIVFKAEDIEDAITAYYTEAKGYPVAVRKEAKMLGEELCVNFYINDNDEDLIVTNIGIKNAINHYLKPKKLEVVSFKQIEQADDNTPYFMGYKVFVKPKAKKLTKEFKENKEQ